MMSLFLLFFENNSRIDFFLEKRFLIAIIYSLDHCPFIFSNLQLRSLFPAISSPTSLKGKRRIRPDLNSPKCSKSYRKNEPALIIRDTISVFLSLFSILSHIMEDKHILLPYISPEVNTMVSSTSYGQGFYFQTLIGVVLIPRYFYLKQQSRLRASLWSPPPRSPRPKLLKDDPP